MARGLGQLDQRQLAEPVKAVALVVLLRADGQHLELGRGLRVEQEEDPVQVAQRLPGERLRLGLRQRVEALRLAAADHLVGDDLDGEADALAQVLGDPDGVLDGVLEDAAPPDAALGVRGERLRAYAGEGAVDLAAALGVVALADKLEVDGQVAALGPACPLGDEQPPSGEHQGELGTVVGDEQRRQQPRRGRERGLLVDLVRGEESPRRPWRSGPRWSRRPSPRR